MVFLAHPALVGRVDPSDGLVCTVPLATKFGGRATFFQRSIGKLSDLESVGSAMDSQCHDALRVDAIACLVRHDQVVSGNARVSNA